MHACGRWLDAATDYTRVSRGRIQPLDGIHARIQWLHEREASARRPAPELGGRRRSRPAHPPLRIDWGGRCRPLYIDRDGNVDPVAAIFFVVFIIIVGPSPLDTTHARMPRQITREPYTRARWPAPERRAYRPRDLLAVFVIVIGPPRRRGRRTEGEGEKGRQGEGGGGARSRSPP
jgi:hypothetical protein